MEPKFPDSWSGLMIPVWRCELMQTLKELADPVHQQKAWLEQAVDRQVINGAGQAYHALFEDLALQNDPKGAVGKFLFDDSETAILAPLVDLMAEIRAELGEPDSARYVSHPRWPEVVGLAAGARAELVKHGEALLPPS